MTHSGPRVLSRAGVSCRVSVSPVDNETYFGTIINNLYKKATSQWTSARVKKFDTDLDTSPCTFISRNYQYSYGQNFKLVDEPTFKENFKTRQEKNKFRDCQ